MEYNFSESYLNESFFDDIESDLYVNDDNNNTPSNLVYRDSIKNILIDELNKLISPFDAYKNITFLYDKHNNLLLISPVKDNGSDCTIDAKHFFDIIEKVYNYSITTILFIGFENVCIDTGYIFKNKNLSYKQEFYNINLIFNVKDITIKHVYIHDVNITANYISLLRCIISNNVKILSNKVLINSCHMTDFSFIKSCSNIRFICESINSLPKTMNCVGIPEGCINLSLRILPITKDENKSLQFSLTGIPSSITLINWDFFWHYYNKFSLNGISKLHIKNNILISLDSGTKNLINYSIYIKNTNIYTKAEYSNKLIIPHRILNIMIDNNSYLFKLKKLTE